MTVIHFNNGNTQNLDQISVVIDIFKEISAPSKRYDSVVIYLGDNCGGERGEKTRR